MIVYDLLYFVVIIRNDGMDWLECKREVKMMGMWGLLVSMSLKIFLFISGLES